MLFQTAPHSLSFNSLQEMIFAGNAATRLLLAAALGAAVGLEREYNRKAAGIRTNLLLCMGCAFFTLLSATLAGDANPDKGRVASNIVQGIGFLGGGLILHDRNRVKGLTSAAGVFVVAAIGMACGAGLFSAAVLSTVIVMLSLTLVGVLEHRFNLKNYAITYQARGGDHDAMLNALLEAMDKVNQRFTVMESDAIGGVERITFQVLGTTGLHRQLQSRLKQIASIAEIHTYRDPEED